MRFFGLVFGPFVFGRVTEDVPQTQRFKLIAWLITIALIAWVSIPFGLILGIPTALYLIATAVARHDTEDQP